MPASPACWSRAEHHDQGTPSVAAFWRVDLQLPLFQGERAGKPLETQDDGAAMSYLLLVGRVSPGREKHHPGMYRLRLESSLLSLPSFPLPSSTFPGEPIHLHPWSFHSSGQPTRVTEIKLRWGCGVHPQTLCFSLMDQTAAGGSSQSLLSRGGTWHVPSQGHARQVAFPSQAP